MDIEAILSVKGHAVSTIRPEVPVAEAMRRMREERIGALVISEDDRRIQGIISDRGILHAITERGVEILDARIDEIMAREVFTCSPRDRVGSIMRLMTDRRIRHIPVVNTDGRLHGLISIGDVVKQRLDEVQREAEAMREYISGVASLPTAARGAQAARRLMEARARRCRRFKVRARPSGSLVAGRAASAQRRAPLSDRMARTGLSAAA